MEGAVALAERDPPSVITRRRRGAARPPAAHQLQRCGVANGRAVPIRAGGHQPPPSADETDERGAARCESLEERTWANHTSDRLRVAEPPACPQVPALGEVPEIRLVEAAARPNLLREIARDKGASVLREAHAGVRVHGLPALDDEVPDKLMRARVDDVQERGIGVVSGDRQSPPVWTECQKLDRERSRAGGL